LRTAKRLSKVLSTSSLTGKPLKNLKLNLEYYENGSIKVVGGPGHWSMGEEYALYTHTKKNRTNKSTAILSYNNN
jgi:hypothetical protein